MILQLIQALYDPRTVLPVAPEFYEKALEDIEFFSIAPQIYTLLKRRSLLGLTPGLFQSRLEQKYKEALYQNIIIKSQLERLLKKFEEAGIPVIPLKGIGFAEKYFGQIGARGTSDIDLLIKPCDLDNANDCVKSMGFTVEQEQIPAHFHWSFSKLLPNSKVPLTVEVHWHLLKDHTSDLSMNEFWNQAKPVQNSKYIKELSDFHTFYMICLHGWKHNMDSLKYFLDIIQMIHSTGTAFEYQELLQQAASHHTSRRLSRTLAIVYHYFPHLHAVKKLPLPEKRKLWWDYNAIRYSNYKPLWIYFNLIYYEFFDFDKVKHSITAIYYFMFQRTNHNIPK